MLPCRCQDSRLRQPRHARRLLHVGVLGEELRPLGKTLRGGVYLVQDEVNRDGDSQTGEALPQLVDVVPFPQVVDGVQKREQPLFLAVSLQHSRGALEEFIVDALVDITGGADGHHERLLPRSCAGYHDFVLFEASVSRPRCNLVRDRELWVISVRSLLAECDLLYRAVALGDIQVTDATALPCPGCKCRRMVHRELEGRIDQITLVELRRYAVDLLTVLALGVNHVRHDGGGQQGLAALASDDHQHLAELSVPLRIHDTEDAGDGSLLPQRELQETRSQASLVMPDKGLNEADGRVRLALVEYVGAVLNSVDNLLIKKTDPPSNDDGAVHYALIVGVYEIIHCRRGNRSAHRSHPRLEG